MDGIVLFPQDLRVWTTSEEGARNEFHLKWSMSPEEGIRKTMQRAVHLGYTLMTTVSYVNWDGPGQEDELRVEP